MTFPYQPQPQIVRKAHWPLTIVISIVTFLLGFGIGFAARPAGKTSVDASAARTGAELAPSTSSPVTSQPETEQPADRQHSGPKTQWGDGLWIVGVDIEPGIYRSPGAKKALFELCIVTLREGVANNSKALDFPVVANADEPIVVEIPARAKAVQVSGCEPLTKIG